MDLTAGKLWLAKSWLAKSWLATMLALLAVPAARAQLGDEIPHASYYAAVQSVYSGEYLTAARELNHETKRGIHTTQTRWIDSICYYTMLGEVLYHQGRNADALNQFDQACQLLLAYPNWLLQVRFQHNPRVDSNRVRRVPPWGRSQRTFVIGQFQGTEQVLVGDLNANDTLQRGGVFRTPMLWRINVVEVMRMSALAIRRRNEILGPLAAQDSINKQLSAALSAGNLAPANHWSGAWIDLLRGLAQAGAGKLDEADMLIGRSLVLDGQFDHPLTGVGLLEQGKVAVIRGDTRRAAQLFAEAGYSAYYFEDWDVLTESVLNGWLNHLANGAAGVYPPLDPVANWAQANRLYHIATKLRLAQAESLLWLGDLGGGAALVDDAGRRIGEMRAGLPGVHLIYLQAAVQILHGRLDVGGEALARALTAQAAASLRNFQILRTNAMFDSRAASARVALELYTALLSDPSPADWSRNPADGMAVVGTSHSPAFDRWFLAALERKDASLALEIAERAKRRRYLATQPFGGRLLALRTLLEAPEADLSNDGLVQRQQLFAAFPDYRALAQAGQQIYAQLRGGPVLAANAADAKPLTALYDQWGRNASQRQNLLAQLAVRRIPSALDFPPMRKAPELQATLRDGEALVVFHSVGESQYGFLVTTSNISMWQLPEARRLRNGLGSFLRELGNYGPNRDMSVEEIKNDSWRKIAKDAYGAIFNDARIDISKITSLVIVPDGLLWNLPFEALIPTGGKSDKPLIDLLPIRYGPTAALAISRLRPLQRPQHTGILAGDMKFAGEPADRDKLLQELAGAVVGALVLPETMQPPARLVAPVLDGLIVLDDVATDAIADASYLFPRSRSNKEKANAWVALPFGGPERVVVTGFKTEAQQGLKTTRREASRTSAARKSSAVAGDEIFQSLCNMMAGGARTVLLTRWRTDGRTNFDLVREFAKESAEAPAAEAWQRACLLARENPIDLTHEPRVKRSDDTGDPPKADHPFFWAGYLLVDTGPRAEQPENAEAPKPDAPKPDAPKEKPLPPPGKAVEEDEKRKPAPDAPKNDAAEKSTDVATAEGAAPPKGEAPKDGEGER